MPATPRADARRNRQAVLDAALDLFRTDPAATMTRIAAAAGVGRVTLHGHFPTRLDLVLAVADQVRARATQALDEVDPDGPAMQVLDRLVAATWSVLADAHAAIEAACRVLPADQVDALYQPVTERLATAVRRCAAGRVPAEDAQWLTVAVSALMYAAAGEVNASRAEPEEAARRLRGSVAAVLGGTRGEADRN
ncbi:TetR/AcrR family transcriptional regulator [Cellulomonas denverensis]|uniref:TetR/AcrR family transcriptional regulator n=1 Tax=Cellulomonas denverensis TaxID=264297 RepID=UPI0035EB1DCE